MLRTVSDLTGLGAAVHAMDISMLTGQFPPAETLLVMAALAVVLGWLAVRMFKWEWASSATLADVWDSSPSGLAPPSAWRPLTAGATGPPMVIRGWLRVPSTR